MQQSHPEMFEAMRQQAAASIMNQQPGSQQQPPGSQG